MASPYTYITSPDYIDSLTFDYVETYSFQRGVEYEENLKIIRPEYTQLKRRKEEINNLTRDDEELFFQLDELLGHTQHLINEKGQFHPSCKKTNTFNIADPIVSRLTNILKTEAKEIPSWLCSPKYRDAIVFYNKNKTIASTLNVCLDCQYMATKMFNLIHGDYTTYDLLKRFFLDIGHDVEDPEYSIVDNLNKLKKKYGKI